MKKQIIEFINSLDSVQDSTEFRINKMMAATFTGKNTHEAIEMFEQYKKAFEIELKARNLNALIENSDIDSYFKNVKEIEVKSFETLALGNFTTLTGKPKKNG